MKTHDDVLKFKEDCGASSVMVARAAQENVSILRKEGTNCQKTSNVEANKLVLSGQVPVNDLITEYLKLCVEFNHSCSKTLYSVNHMLRNSEKSIVGYKGYKQLQNAKSLEEIWLYLIYECTFSNMY